MALSFNMTIHQPSPSSGTISCSGLKLQCPGRPNATPHFFASIRKSLQCGTRNRKAMRTPVTMMPIGIPQVWVKNPQQRGGQFLDIWNALYRQRIVFIGREIDEEFSNELLATMLYLDAIDNQSRLRMYIIGDGGDLSPCLQIYDTMKNMKSPVHTFCTGYASNMAAFLLSAGEKGNRAATPRSMITFGSLATSAQGRADHVENEAKELLRIRNYLYDDLAKVTGHPFEKIDKDLKKRKSFNAEEATEYGIIDRILRPPRLEDRPTRGRRSRRVGLG